MTEAKLNRRPHETMQSVAYDDATVAHAQAGHRRHHIERDTVVSMLQGFDTPGMVDVLAAHAAAWEKYEQAREDLRTAERALTTAQTEHADKVRAAVREDKKPPKAATFRDLEAAIRDANTVLDARAGHVLELQRKVKKTGAENYPAMRETVLARLDEAQALLRDALGKIDGAIAARDDMLSAIVMLDTHLAEPYAREVRGFKRPLTGEHTTLANAAAQTRAMAQVTQVAHHVSRLRRTLDADRDVRRHLDAIGPDHYQDHNAAKAQPAQVV